MKKRILSILLIVVLILNCLPGEIGQQLGIKTEVKAETIIGQNAEVGESVYIGMYPQKKVTDSNLISKLKELPVNDDKVVLDGTAYLSQGGNWFKIEPIEWIVLENNDGNAFLVSKDVIDATRFQAGDGSWRHVTYEKSTIREYINKTLYETAFSSQEKRNIQTSLIENTEGNSTSDKLFLPLRDELSGLSTLTVYCSDYASDKGYYLRDSYYYTRKTWSAYYGLVDVIEVYSGNRSYVAEDDPASRFGIRPCMRANISNIPSSKSFSGYDEWGITGKRINIKYAPAKTKAFSTLPADYSDGYFMESSYEYNHKLAWLSLCLELSSWTVNDEAHWGEEGTDNSDIAKERYSYVADTYSQMGFEDPEYHNYGKSLNTSTDKVAYSFARKKIGDDTVIAVVIRGGGYGNEWSSNFNVGNGNVHGGFFKPSVDIYEKAIAYASKVSGNIKFWVTGYSRGGAVANLVAAQLNDYAQSETAIDNNGIFAYTFATPQGVTNDVNVDDNKYDNIFNIVFPLDFVTQVAPSAWRFSRFGVTKYFDMRIGKDFINTVTKKRKTISGTAWDINASKKQESLILALLGLVTGQFPTLESSQELQKVIQDIIMLYYTRVKVDGKWQKIKSFDDYYDALYEKYGNEIMVSQQKAEAFFKSTDVGYILMQIDLIKNNEYLQNILKLLVTICYQDGLDYNKMCTLAKEFASNKQLLPTFFDIITGLNANGKLSADGLKKAHEPYTYLAWMSFSESNIFTDEFIIDPSCYTSTESDYAENYNNLLIQTSNWTKYAAYRKSILDNKSTVIPGYKQTNMANGNICTTMVPQGVCQAGDYILISAYDSTKQNNSVIFVMDRNTKEYITTLVLSAHKSHVGAMDYDNKNQIVYIADSSGANSYLLRMLHMDVIKRAVAKHKDASFVTVNESFPLHEKKPSFITYYRNKLFVGTIGEDGKKSYVTAYSTGSEHSAIMSFGLPTNAQGAAFVDYKGKTYLICSSSKGRLNPSTLYVFEMDVTNENKYILLNSSETVMPNMSEDVEIIGNTIYIAYEAAAAKYSEGLQSLVVYPIDRVIASSLSTMMNGGKKGTKKGEVLKSDDTLPEDVLAEGSFGEDLNYILFNDGVLDITGYGDMPDFDSEESAPWYDQRSEITSVCIGADVTCIGTNAFSNCENLISLNISKFSDPDTTFAFHTNSFNGCGFLSEIILPDKTYEIAEDAFGDTDLSKITVTGGSEAFISFMVGKHAISHEHDFRFDSTKEHTCSSVGYDKYVCSGCCEISYRNVTEATGEHKYQLIDSMEATCAADGYEVYECTECGCTSTKTLEALEHTFDEGIIESESTCIFQGEKVYTCEVCGYKETEYLELAAHKAMEPVQENRKEATCTEDGSYDKVVYCEICSDEISREPIIIQSHGHTPSTPVKENISDPLCETAGSYDEVVYCSVCNEEISRDRRVVEKTGHTIEAPVKENIREATCETPGSYDEVTYCSVCDKEISRNTVITEATGHIEGTPVKENVIKETCETPGSYDEVVYCTACNKELSRESKTVEATGHRMADPVKENEIPASYLEDGHYESVVYCANCGKEFSRESVTIPKLETKNQTIKVTKTTYNFTYDSSKAQSQTFNISGAEGGLSYIFYCGRCIDVEDGKIVVEKGTSPGTYQFSVTGMASYDGEYKESNTVMVTVKVDKASNKIKVTPGTKKLKYSKVRKKAQSFTIKATQAQGKVTYKSNNKKVKVTSKGKVTVKKGTKKGKYKITVTAAGNWYYKKASKTVTVIVK